VPCCQKWLRYVHKYVEERIQNKILLCFVIFLLRKALKSCAIVLYTPLEITVPFNILQMLFLMHKQQIYCLIRVINPTRIFKTGFGKLNTESGSTGCHQGTLRK